MSDYDVVVIGTGIAGAAVATGCAAGGLRVAITDRIPYGGTCAQRGCDPKKVLVAASEAVARFEGLKGQGLEGDVRIDWRALQRRKRSFVEGVPQRTEKRLADAGVTLLHGEARFASRDALDIGGERVEAGSIVIATGAVPEPLDIAGEELLTHSDEFMDLEELPPSVVFVGGGYISFEFAGLARRAGAEASIVHRSSHVLTGFDPELAAMLVERYRGLGIEVLLDTPAKALRRDGDELVLETPDRELRAELMVHGAGRVPDLAALDLERGGVEAGDHGVLVDEHLRSTSNPRVYAGGDASSAGLPLTPPASREANVLVQAILGDPVAYDPTATATVTFSDPPLASVGMSTGAAERRDDLEVVASDMSGWFTSRRVGLTHAGSRIVREKESGKLLGAHLLGVNADEVINVFALAIRRGLTSDEVKDAVYAYPTSGSDIGYML